MDTMNGKQVDEKWANMSDISESMRSRLKSLQSIEAPEPFATAQNLAVYWGLMVNVRLQMSA